VEKGEKLCQLQLSLFINALQNKNFAWRSYSNHWEKHRTTFANVVEGCLIYNFRIYCFCRTVQIFGETHGQSRVDRLATSPGHAPGRRRRASDLPGLACAAHGVPRPPRRSCRPSSHHLEARAVASLPATCHACTRRLAARHRVQRSVCVLAYHARLTRNDRRTAALMPASLRREGLEPTALTI
jgi:hypothetical protein